MKKVGIVMGSDSDLPILRKTMDTLKQLDIPFECHVFSAHRTPEEARDFALNARRNGFGVMIAAAGMAAHLGGVFAAHTVLPVIGIPVASEPFNGLDSLLSFVQMPPGIPVATVTAGKAGGKNAALYALSILAVQDAGLREQLKAFRREQAEQVLKADAELQEELKGN